MLKFTQKNGFEEVADVFEWKDGDTEKVGLKRAGFDPRDVAEDGPGGEGASMVLVVYQRAKTGEGERYVVHVASTWQDWNEWILVPDAASLMALRIQMAPLMTLNNVSVTVDEVKKMAERAFRAWHGHSHLQPCNECDPDGARQ